MTDSSVILGSGAERVAEAGAFPQACLGAPSSCISPFADCSLQLARLGRGGGTAHRHRDRAGTWSDCPRVVRERVTVTQESGPQ